MEYLGHVISNGTLSIDPSKIEAILNWPLPMKNVREVQSYLGSNGYFRKFIPNYSLIARPLHALTRKDAKFLWTDEHTQAVRALNNAIVHPQCLALFDSARDTFLTTDASQHAMGAVLAQMYEHGERPVAFLSKALSGAQLQYSMWEKELFAVVWAVKELRPYLRTHHFTLRCDNKPSVQLLNSTNIKFSTIATARILRWITILQSYSFTPTHTPGKQNVVADALSRFPVNANIAPADVETALYCQQAVISYPSADLTPDFHRAYSEVPFLKDLFQQLRDNVFHPRYTLLHDLIVSRDTPARVYVPDDIPLRLRLF